MAVNLRGVLLGLQAAGRAMRDMGGGSVVVTSSAAGLTGVRMSAAYSTSTHGVVGLIKSAALELGPVGIRVNTICPGYITSNVHWQKASTGDWPPTPPMSAAALHPNIRSTKQE